MKELQRQDILENLKLNVLWRAAAMSALPENPEYFQEQKNLLNQAISSYLDELIPERRLERVQAVESSQEKMDKLVKKKPPLGLFTNNTNKHFPKKGKSISLGKPKNGR